MARGKAGGKEEKPDKQLFSLRLPRRLWAELGVLARLRGVPLNELLVGVLQAYWDAQPEKATVARLVKTSGAGFPRERGKAGEPE
jgi:hypothetical protein